MTSKRRILEIGGVAAGVILIAFGLFSSWATVVTALTAVAVVWMLFYFARAGARHPRPPPDRQPHRHRPDRQGQRDQDRQAPDPRRP